MNIKPTFREAQRGDCALILDFIKGIARYEKLEDKVVATVELLEEWIFEKQSAWVIFPVVDSKEVGFAVFCQNFSTFMGRAGMYLEDIYIMPEYRGQGIGKQLIEFSIEAARGYGKKYLRLYTSTDPNEAAAQFLYEKYGFRVFRVERKYWGALLYRERVL